MTMARNRRSRSRRSTAVDTAAARPRHAAEFERKRDYLAGFLAEREAGAEPTAAPAASCRKR